MTGRVSAQIESAEHPENGVGTGLDHTPDVAEAGRVLAELASGWREGNRLDVWCLRALISLSLEQPERADEGFDAWEVAAEVGKLTGRNWGAGDTREGLAGKVRDNWKRLTEEVWPVKLEGVRQAFSSRALSSLPVLERVVGGGQGNPTRYKIQYAASSEDDVCSNAQTAERSVEPKLHNEQQKVELRYICEDVTDANWLANLFGRGFTLEGVRVIAIRVVLIAGVLAVTLMALLVPLSMIGAKSLLPVFYAALTAAMCAYAFWANLGSIFVLRERRVALAPWWMQSIDDDRLLEWRGPPRYPVKSIKAVRYTATCPLCDGKVVVRSGGFRRLWALVGRCEEAPDAHVFSFDHVLRLGVRKAE